MQTNYDSLLNESKNNYPIKIDPSVNLNEVDKI